VEERKGEKVQDELDEGEKLSDILAITVFLVVGLDENLVDLDENLVEDENLG
jgi:hypothetical protein